jgi:hypothetical protein
MKQFDAEQLKSILNLRSFETKNDENAGDFIDNIKTKESKNKAYNQPELPL